MDDHIPFGADQLERAQVWRARDMAHKRAMQVGLPERSSATTFRLHVVLGMTQDLVDLLHRAAGLLTDEKAQIAQPRFRQEQMVVAHLHERPGRADEYRGDRDESKNDGPRPKGAAA